MAKFQTRIRTRSQIVRSWLCVGLDPDPRLLPESVRPTPSSIVDFCRAVASATHPHAVAFKLNFAFYERLGGEGWKALEAVRRAIPDDVPVIADAKRGDIANTARAYAEAIFDALAFDAVTLNPYLGWDSLEPFTRYEGKGLFVLCKTSNPGSPDLQDLDVGGAPLYLAVARGALSLAGPAEVGLVVGATYPRALREVRALG
ncbi:MAG: orotidine-5'-phosphate decarboxylase, partial [Chloroflexi bacterium]|nr:orotidine-5'-phosphate decarboxylase [Chloroflexota bacterium]